MFRRGLAAALDRGAPEIVAGDRSDRLASTRRGKAALVAALERYAATLSAEAGAKP